MGREFARLSLAPSLALVILEIRFELVRALELAGFERVLIWSETAIGRRKPGFEIVVDVVEGDSEGSPDWKEGGGQSRELRTKYEERHTG